MVFPFAWLLQINLRKIQLIFLKLDIYNYLHHLPNKLITYTGLLNDIYYRPKEIDTPEVIKLVRQAGAIPQQLLPFKGVIHVIDYTKRSPVAYSGPCEDMLGYNPRDVIENGLDFVINIFHKDDFKIYNESIFTRIVEKLRSTPLEEHDNLIFSFNYRIRRGDGKWMHLYQQTNYVTDPVSRLPLYNIGICTDITPLKNNNGMVFTIDKRSRGQTFLHPINIATEYYFPDAEDNKLSKREKEVLGWLADGFSSKQIAAKLYLSGSPIIIHRKNMLKKTNTKNIAELVRYASKHGLI
jgi:DNA-binding CsgD family transcriptional regulator